MRRFLFFFQLLNEAMTEVAEKLPAVPAGDKVLSVRHYEAGPPANVIAELAVSIYIFNMMY